MSGVATAIAAGAVVGAVVQSDSARRASNAQTNSANQANDTQRYMYDQTREDQAPWREAGQGALNQMRDSDFQRDFTMADFAKDPGYQFRMDEANKAIERSAAARGGLNSGRTLKELTRYDQDYASNEFNNAYNRFNNDRNQRFNRLSAIAGVGQTANSQTANAGMNYGNNVSNNIMAAGNAEAAGAVGGANAINNAVGSGMNSWMQYQMMNRMFPVKGA